MVFKNRNTNCVEIIWKKRTILYACTVMKMQIFNSLFLKKFCTTINNVINILLTIVVVVDNY